MFTICDQISLFDNTVKESHFQVFAKHQYDVRNLNILGHSENRPNLKFETREINTFLRE